MALVRALQPDLWVPILDAPSSAASLKRHHKSVDRTLRWLDECLRLAHPGQAGQEGEAGQDGKGLGDPGRGGLTPQRGARFRTRKGGAASDTPAVPHSGAANSTVMGQREAASVPLWSPEGDGNAPLTVAEGARPLLRCAPGGGRGGGTRSRGGGRRSSRRSGRASRGSTWRALARGDISERGALLAAAIVRPVPRGPSAVGFFLLIILLFSRWLLAAATVC